MAVLLDTSSLQKIGDMTSGGGLTAAVNPNDSGSTGYKTAATGWAGVTLAAPTTSAFRILTFAFSGGASTDCEYIFVAFYGDQ